MASESDLVLIIPVPQKDRHGISIPKTRQRMVLRRLLAALGSWFGSATALPSWGSWKSESRAPLSIDPGQSVCLVLTTTGKFRRRRPALIRLLRREGAALDQEQMAAIAFKSARGSVLIRCRT
jgi:hypothetical protein